jgi:hypothetical protein
VTAELGIEPAASEKSTKVPVHYKEENLMLQVAFRKAAPKEAALHAKCRRRQFH